MSKRLLSHFETNADEIYILIWSYFPKKKKKTFYCKALATHNSIFFHSKRKINRMNNGKLSPLWRNIIILFKRLLFIQFHLGSILYMLSLHAYLLSPVSLDENHTSHFSFLWSLYWKSLLSQNVIIDCKSKGGEKSFELQERGTALKNKGDRWQYINFMRMKKKNQLIKIDYSCFVNVFLN